MLSTADLCILSNNIHERYNHEEKNHLNVTLVKIFLSKFDRSYHEMKVVWIIFNMIFCKKDSANSTFKLFLPHDHFHYWFLKKPFKKCQQTQKTSVTFKKIYHMIIQKVYLHIAHLK